MTFREQLLSAPQRNFNEVLHNVTSLYIIPTRRKHDSGYNCMVYVAVVKDENGNKKYVRCGGYSDHLYARIENLSKIPFLPDCSFSIDCEKGVIRLYNFGNLHTNGFSVGEDLSTVDIAPEI